ncbi:50S ribosomal protein L19, partial [Patescibacteria group bacterium]|nr:50S ribosomal protein L19 [Patescibacteria group bacterium]
IDKIEVLKKADVRRAKLYYMRERSGKRARMKSKNIVVVPSEGQADSETAEA